MLATLLAANNDGTGAAGAGFFLGFTLLGLAVVAVQFYAFWRVFERMGEPGWAGIIPIYNYYCIYKRTRGDQAVLFTILSVVPCVNIVMAFILLMDLAKLFGKEPLTGILWAIPCVGTVLFLMFAFGDDAYVGPVVAPGLPGSGGGGGGGYPPQQGGYAPPPQGGYPPQPGGYAPPPQPGGFPPPPDQGGFPPPPPGPGGV